MYEYSAIFKERMEHAILIYSLIETVAHLRYFVKIYD